HVPGSMACDKAEDLYENNARAGSSQLERDKNSSKQSAPTPASRRNQRRRELASREPLIKQEMGINVESLLREARGNGIDLTSNTPPDSPGHYSSPGPIPPNDDMENDNSGPIDLTMDEVIDLTGDIEISEDERTSRPPAADVTRNDDHAGGQHDEESDRDSLFNASDGQDNGGRGGIDFDQGHLNSFASEAPAPIPDPYPTTEPPTSNVILTKRISKPGRKRALDMIDGPAKDKPKQQAKKRRIEPNATSLFTAVRGKAIVRGRDGGVTKFNAVTSAGSDLAAKKALEKSLNLSSTTSTFRPDSNTPAIQTPGTSVSYIPVTNADDLEDFEDEEQNNVPDAREEDMQQEAVNALRRERWGMISKPTTTTEIVEEFLPDWGTLPAPDPEAPPLFLLRLSKQHTLRLMLKDWSKHQWQWYPRSKILKKEENDDARSSLPNTPTRRGSVSEVEWVQHKMALLDLVPQYHQVAQDISSKRIYSLWLDWSNSKDETERAYLKSQAVEERNSDGGWRLGEEERTGVIPLVADCSRAEELLFTVTDGTNAWRLDKPETSQVRKQVGSWAFLMPWEHHGKGGRSEGLSRRLARYLEVKEKFLIVQSPLVDEHNKHPHTLLIFASKSHHMGSLCGIPDEFKIRVKSLVMVHIVRVNEEVGQLTLLVATISKVLVHWMI
ncbi:1457_t:CDS:2, partial [Acaulospora colombiana]